MLIEPVLGEGGYVPAPTAFLQGLEAICREHGILFVADEVQTGFGRTGTMFCVEQHGIRPDVVVMAKGIASGFPISAVGASAELMARWPTGSHGGTYGGNPIGCAAAIATIDVLTEPGFLDEVSARGEQLRAGLRTLAAEDGGIADVRGPGLMVATELADAARVPALLEALPHRGPAHPHERRHLRQRHPLDAAPGGERGRGRHRPRRLRQGAGRHPLTTRPGGPAGASLRSCATPGTATRVSEAVAGRLRGAEGPR